MPIFWRIVTFLLYSVRIILCLNQIKKEKEMDQMPACPKCKGEYVYHDSVNFVCPDCGNEWNGNEAVEADEDQLIVKDSNGNLLADGDDVLLTKDLKLKGSSEVLKKGTKFKNIRLVNGDHNVDCGKIMLKSEFLKKA
jgi:protein PhnA